MTAAQRQALLIDAERRKLERRGVRAAAVIASRARRLRDPRAAIALLKRQAVPLLVDAMLAAHLSGMRRPDLTAAPRFRSRTGYKLAGTVYDDALDFLNKRSLLFDVQLTRLRVAFGDAAAGIINTATEALNDAINETVRESVIEGLGARQGARRLRQVWEDQGLAPASPYRLEAVFRTQVNTAYAAGRAEGNRDPAVDQILWGFEYVAIVDDRTTELCQKLDGMRRPKFDPVWQTYTPPNHWSCRSTVIEIFDSGDATAVPADIQPVRGFAFNPGDVYRAVAA